MAHPLKTSPIQYKDNKPPLPKKKEPKKKSFYLHFYPYFLGHSALPKLKKETIGGKPFKKCLKTYISDKL